MSLSQRIRTLREECGLTREELANRLNVTYWALSKYESGERTPDLETIAKIACRFGVTVDYLLGLSDTPRAPYPTFIIPILGTIRAGLPLLAEENWIGEVEAPAEWRGDFAIRVEGDSMSWVGINDGDTAILRQVEIAQHGMIVAAGIQDVEWTATLKFYIRENGQAYLRAANPAYQDISIGPEHRIIGQLVGVLKEPPSLQQYKDHLVSKEVADRQWAETIEKATQLGLDGSEVGHMINLFAKVSRSGGSVD